MTAAHVPAFSIAHWCILIAALLPLLCSFIAKWGQLGRPRSQGGYDNADPRGWLAKQENPRVRRADSAQKNSFEAFPAFAASVFMAQLAGVEPQRIGWLALGFVVLRTLYGFFYVVNNPAMRSMVWFGGFACVFALMGMAIAQAL